MPADYMISFQFDLKLNMVYHAVINGPAIANTWAMVNGSSNASVTETAGAVVTVVTFILSWVVLSSPV